MIPVSAYVAVSAVLFATGLLGVLIRRNFIIVLMAVEIMLNAAYINLVAFSHYLESMAGQIVALFIIAIAAEGFTVATIETYKTFFFPNKPRGKWTGKPVHFPDMLETRQRFRTVYFGIWAAVIVAFALAFRA